jgi:hypothetical protein
MGRAKYSRFIRVFRGLPMPRLPGTIAGRSVRAYKNSATLPQVAFSKKHASHGTRHDVEETAAVGSRLDEQFVALDQRVYLGPCLLLTLYYPEPAPILNRTD